MLYFLILFFMIIGSLFIFYRISASIIYDTVKESMERSVEQMGKDTENILSEIKEQARQISLDYSVQRVLREKEEPQDQAIYFLRNTTNYSLYSRNRMLPQIQGIYLICENGAVYRSVLYTPKNEDLRNTTWFKMTKNTKKALWFYSPKGSEVVQDLHEPTISYTMPIKDNVSEQINGICVIEMAADKLTSVNSDSLIFQGSACIFDKTGDCINSSVGDENLTITELQNETKKIAFARSDESRDFTFHGKKYLLSAIALKDPDWKIIGVVSYSFLNCQLLVLQNSILLVLGIFLAFATLFATLGTRSVLIPIHILQKGMSQVEKGDFTTFVYYDHQDELGELVNSFNHMIARINDLQKKELKNQKELRKAEFNALQSQINPHFLYNTLDSIVWMIRMKKSREAEKMISDLSSFLRIGLSRGHEIISLRDELLHVQSYINIQKIRYPRILHYKVEVPSNLMDIPVVKMILQPLVENSLNHGLKEKNEPGLICVSGSLIHNMLILTVEDDGLGMTPEKVQELHQSIDEGIGKTSNAYGIINVQQRLQNYYGQKYGLEFESIYNKGTIFRIKIPLSVNSSGAEI